MSGRGAKMVAMVREIDVGTAEPLEQIFNIVNDLPFDVEVNKVCSIPQHAGEVDTGNALNSAFENGNIRSSCSENIRNNESHLPGALSVGDIISLEQPDIQILDNLVCTIIQDTDSNTDNFQVICEDENANVNVDADMELLENRLNIVNQECGDNNNDFGDIDSAENQQEAHSEYDTVDDPDYVPPDDESREDIILDSKSSEVDNNPKKKRRHHALPESWEKNVNKKKRMLGEEYRGYTRSNSGIIKHEIMRDKRTLGPTCDSNFCKKASNRFCQLFTDETRQTIFNKFWNMTWEQKRIFVSHMTSYGEKKRCYTKNSSRRSGSFQYYLKMDSVKYQVCKKLFLRTLGINEKMVTYWINDGIKYGLPAKSEDRNRKKFEKKQDSSLFVEMKKRKDYLQMFLKGLDKMESHYCRSKTDKLYLEEDFKSKSQVYDIYKKKCLENNMIPLSLYPFLKEFDEMNIALFKPSKDQCDLCIGYKVKQVCEVEYQEHISAKDQAREEKESDKKKAEEKLIHCFTMDFQAVKLCPKLQASAPYYKAKLQVHNFTMYNLASHDSHNFIWNELEGELDASVFTSCIVKHLENILHSEIKPIVLFSDSCGYQNKNACLSNALSLLATKYNIDIEQKYLEKGHTQMECDSTHSLIERRLKGRDIFLPTDYIGIIKDARKNPKPLDVEYLNHTFFLNYDDPQCMRYISIRPGRTKNDPKVSDLKCLKYLPSGKIMYKIKYTDQYKELPQRQKSIDKNYSLQPLYSERLKINKKKWMHLQELKKVLPLDTHFFYDTISYYEQTDHSISENSKETASDNRKKKEKTVSIDKKKRKDAENSQFIPLKNCNREDADDRNKSKGRTSKNNRAKQKAFLTIGENNEKELNNENKTKINRGKNRKRRTEAKSKKVEKNKQKIKLSK